MKRMITCILCVAVLVALTAANVMCADEPKLFQDNPQLRATLEQWEAEADPVVKQYIAVLRAGGSTSIVSESTENKLAALKGTAKGAVLALIEMLGNARKVPILISKAGGTDSMTYSGDGSISQGYSKQLEDKYSNTTRGWTAAVILGSIGEPAVEPLIFVLKSTNNIVRANAATALGYIKDARAAEPLIAASNDTNRDVCRAVISALIKLNDVKAVPVLISALSNKDVEIRFAAEKALGNIKDTKAVDPLITASNGSNGDVYHTIISILIKLNDVKSVPVLINALSKKDAHIRSMAAEALGTLRDPRAFDPLIAMLKDKDKAVRESVMLALDKLMPGVDQSKLANLALEFKDSFIRLAAAGRLTDQALLGRVAVESKDVDLRVIAAWKLDDPAALANVAKNDVDAAVRQAATNRQAYKTQVVDIGGGVQMELVLIALGSFKMGSDKGEAYEKPVHEVKITEPFYIGKYEVTQEQWEKVMGSNPSIVKEPKNPVTNVSWDDCQIFIGKLNEKIGDSKFSLPTEAQWEYACRAGSTSEFFWGDDKGALGKYAWLKGNSGGKPNPVGEKMPNAWGLYDMSGNVLEWCSDWWDENYYKNSPTLNPIGPATGEFRALRGGTCINAYDFQFQCAGRSNRSAPTHRFISVGFRCARTL